MMLFLEFDRQADQTGTPEQQQAIRDSYTPLYLWGTPLTQVMFAVAKSVKTEVRYVPITFIPNVGFGLANRWQIWINSTIGVEHTVTAFWHELGHVVGIHLFYDRSEGWAEEFRTWIVGGCPTEADGQPHPTWLRLQAGL